MTDFSRIRTLDQLSSERVRLEQELSHRRAVVSGDIRRIQRTWQKRTSLVGRLCHVFEYVALRPQTKTVMGLLSSALFARLLRRWKARC